MSWNTRVNRYVVALVTFSLVLSLVGASSPAMADVVENEATPAIPDQTQDELISPPDPGEIADDPTLPEGDEPAQVEPTDPALQDEDESADAGDAESDAISTPDDDEKNDGVDTSSRSSDVGPLVAEESTVTIVVEMVDGGLIPSGLRTYIYASGDWTHLENIPLTGGETTATATFSASFPYGSYGLGVTGNGYSSLQAITLDEGTESHTFRLDRLTGNMAVTMNTSDGGGIPAGTSWTLSHAQDGVVDSGILDTPLANGSLLPIPANPLAFGEYELSFTPQADPSGRYVDPVTISIPLTNAWVPDQSVTANLEIVVPSGSVSFSVQMVDGGEIPHGLQWSIMRSGSWDPIAVGTVAPGGTLFEHEIDEQLPHGRYSLWITGNGYSTGQVINVNSAEVSHGFSLTRLYGNLSVIVTTSDGTDIPAGTAWEILDAEGTTLQHGTLDAALSSGSTLALDNPLENGIYTLNIGPASDSLVPLALEDLPRDLLPFSTTINITTALESEYSITAELQWAQSDLTFTVSMSDGGPLPNGMEWMLVLSGSWDPLASGEVPAGDSVFTGGISEAVPFGIYQIWVTGNGYSSGQVLNVQHLTTHHDFVIDRLLGEVAVTLETSNGAAVPAGTIWSITDSAGSVVQSGELADELPVGSTLPLTNPLEFDVYTLSINADGYFPLTIEIDITNSWITEYAYTAELQEELSTVTFTVSMTDGGSLPNGLEWMLVPSGSWDPIASGQVPAGELSFAGEVADPLPFDVYQLWITGNGYSSGQVLNITSAETHHDFELDRLYAVVTVVLDTSDDADIPAGTNWAIVDSAGNPIQDDVLTSALKDGGALSLANPLEFDVYTLVIDAEGYHLVSMELPVTNPWLSEVTFTVNLVSDALPEPEPTAPATPEPTVPTTPEPEPTEPSTPEPVDPTPDSTPDEAPHAPVTGLPQTGVGESGATVMLMLLAASVMTVAAGFLWRVRASIIR